MKHIVIVMNYWGKADTVKQALANAKSAGGRMLAKDKVMVIRAQDDEAWIDGMGCVCYTPKDNGQPEYEEIFKGTISELKKSEVMR